MRGDGAHLLGATAGAGGLFILAGRGLAAAALDGAHGGIGGCRLLPRDERGGAPFDVLRPLGKLGVVPHVAAVHDDLERVRYDVGLASLADGVLHLVLEVGADEVVLAGVHVAHCGLRELLRELLPRVQSGPEVLAHVQAPDALELEHLGEPLELLVEEAILEVLYVQRLDLRVGLQRVEDGVDDQGTRVGLDETLQAENFAARVAVEGVVGEPGGEIRGRLGGSAKWWSIAFSRGLAEGWGRSAHLSMKSLNAGDSSVRDSGFRLGRLPASLHSSSAM